MAKRKIIPPPTPGEILGSAMKDLREKCLNLRLKPDEPRIGAFARYLNTLFNASLPVDSIDPVKVEGLLRHACANSQFPNAETIDLEAYIVSAERLFPGEFTEETLVQMVKAIRPLFRNNWQRQDGSFPTITLTACTALEVLAFIHLNANPSLAQSPLAVALEEARVRAAPARTSSSGRRSSKNPPSFLPDLPLPPSSDAGTQSPSPEVRISIPGEAGFSPLHFDEGSFVLRFEPLPENETKNMADILPQGLYLQVVIISENKSTVERVQFSSPTQARDVFERIIGQLPHDIGDNPTTTRGEILQLVRQVKDTVCAVALA